MDSSQPAPTTLDTLRTVEFRLGLKGYNVDEVDEYLEKAAVEAEALQEQLRQSVERLRQASDRIAQLETERREAPAAAAAAEPVADDSLQRTLILAQKFVDQTKRESEAQAAEVVAHAEERARATISKAEEEARKLAAESEQRLREEVARLESLRGQLAGDVENMARHLESERERIRGALGDVVKWVEEHLQASGALTAVRTRGAASPPPSSAGTRPPEAGRVAPPRPLPGTPLTGGEDRPPGRPDTDTDPVAQVLDLRGAGPGSSADRG